MSRSPRINGSGVIAVAGGEHKVEAIRAAIVGGFVNTLIADIDTAESLLEIVR